MIKHIIFDLGNVLVHIHPQRAMDEFAQRYHLGREVVASFFLSEEHLHYMQGHYSTAEYFDRLRKRFGVEISDEEMTRIWNRVIGTPKEGIPEMVNALSRRFTLSVCSNTDPVHWQYCLENYLFLRKFKFFFLSFEMGIIKPNRRVFEKMLNTLKSPAGDCLFIDDTMENIHTAEEMGFKTIHGEEPEKIKQELIQLGVLGRMDLTAG